MHPIVAKPVAQALIELAEESNVNRPRRRLRESAGLGLIHAGLRVLGREGDLVPIRRGDQALALIPYRMADDEPGA